jgi:ankyrin repeat protein
LEFLLKNGFDARVIDKLGRSALDLACFKNEPACVVALLAYGADWSTHDRVSSRTPVHAAAYNNNEECLKMIAIHEERSRQNAAVVDKSLTASAIALASTTTNGASNGVGNNNYYYYDTFFDDSRVFKNCQHVANVVDALGRTPLMIAVEQGHLNTASFLVLNLHADVMLCDNNMRTALHRAVSLGFFFLCHLILTLILRNLY